MSDEKVVVISVSGDIDDIRSSAILKLHEESGSAIADVLQGLGRFRVLLTGMSLSAVADSRTAFAVEAGARGLGAFLLGARRANSGRRGRCN